MSKIISTNGTPLNTEANGPRGGYVALGTLGSKLVVLSLLNKSVIKFAPSEMKEMKLKADLGAEWCDENYLEFDEKKELNRPGFRGGCLVKVKPGIRSSRQVAESSLPQPRPVEYTQWAPAVGGG